jgi:pimeloyl-ACP methyl ester carboxylesterase
VHYHDESPAGISNPPVVVLSHASFMSLRSWDALAAGLVKNGYRVIRMDYLNAGLTSFDPKDINDMGRNVRIIAELPGRLGVSRYHLIGTSSGGQIGFIHAGDHPERIERFVLINSGGMPRTAQSNPNRERGNFVEQWINRQYRSKAKWQEDLEGNIPSLRPLPDDFVEMVYDMNRRTGGRPAAAQYLKNFRTGDTAAYLAKVKAPTLILQGMSNPRRTDGHQKISGLRALSVYRKSGCGRGRCAEVLRRRLRRRAATDDSRCGFAGQPAERGGGQQTVARHVTGAAGT